MLLRYQLSVMCLEPVHALGFGFCTVLALRLAAFHSLSLQTLLYLTIDSHKTHRHRDPGADFAHHLPDFSQEADLGIAHLLHHLSCMHHLHRTGELCSLLSLSLPVLPFCPPPLHLPYPSASLLRCVGQIVLEIYWKGRGPRGWSL